MEFVKQHKLIVFILVIVLVGVGWYEFTSNSTLPPAIVTTGIGNATDTQDAQLVSTLLQLQSVTLSGTILNDPGFLNLQDFTTQIISESIGRSNPFAPLTSQTPTVATSTQHIDPNLFAPKSTDK